MRYRLRTLLIVLALGPPVLAWLVPILVEWFRPPKPNLINWPAPQILIDGNGSRGIQP
jgi:hypothetical protein